jgi:NHL repeat
VKLVDDVHHIGPAHRVGEGIQAPGPACSIWIVGARRGTLAAIAAIAAAALAPTVSPARGAEGRFDRTWGKDVVSSNAETGFEVCLPLHSCKAGVSGGLGGEMSLPIGVATDAAGSVYLADQNNGRIQKFDSSGNFLRAWGKDVVSGGGTGFEVCAAAASCKAGAAGGLGGEMNSPTSVATDAAGNVYVADALNHRIQKFADPPARPSPEGPVGRADRSVTLDANKNKVKKGRKVRLFGRITKLAGQGECESAQNVLLQRKRPKRTAFTTVQQLQTEAQGSFSTKRKVKKTFQYRAEAPETANCAEGLSNTEKVKVKKKSRRR